MARESDISSSVCATSQGAIFQPSFCIPASNTKRPPTSPSTKAILRDTSLPTMFLSQAVLLALVAATSQAQTTSSYYNTASVNSIVSSAISLATSDASSAVSLASSYASSGSSLGSSYASSGESLGLSYASSGKSLGSSYASPYVSSTTTQASSTATGGGAAQSSGSSAAATGGSSAAAMSSSSSSNGAGSVVVGLTGLMGAGLLGAAAFL